MKEHEHATKKKPETKPERDEVAEKAYANYLKEGRPQGHDVQNGCRSKAKCRTPNPTTRTIMPTWRFSETVLDRASYHPADSRALTNAPNADEYRAYRKRVPMFIPRWSQWRNLATTRSDTLAASLPDTAKIEIKRQ